MHKRRNKYAFRWWHGLLGLIGLSMVLGTVQAVAAGRQGNGSTRTGTYRNYTIEVGPSTSSAGWWWVVRDAFGQQVEVGDAVTSGAAWSAAQRYIDWFLNIDAAGPARNPYGYAPAIASRCSQLTTPPLDQYVSWQEQWKAKTR